MSTTSPTPTVSPQELGLFLDTVASAPVALRDVPRINSILARLVGLANAKQDIGSLPSGSPIPLFDEDAPHPPSAAELADVHRA